MKRLLSNKPSFISSLFALFCHIGINPTVDINNTLREDGAETTAEREEEEEDLPSTQPVDHSEDESTEITVNPSDSIQTIPFSIEDPLLPPPPVITLTIANTTDPTREASLEGTLPSTKEDNSNNHNILKDEEKPEEGN